MTPFAHSGCTDYATLNVIYGRLPLMVLIGHIEKKGTLLMQDPLGNAT